MQQIGRYEVVRSLGQGGMGQVYLARDPKLERQVAIKLLHREDEPTARGLFEREAKVLAALNHPNIVTIFEIAEIDGRQFIAMEYLPGRSLRDLLQQAKPSRDDLVAICGQVAIALAAAHEAGILHRDIKPENVVVGKALAVKVVDFGIARQLNAPASNDPSVARRNTPKDLKAHTAAIVDVFTRTIRVDVGGVNGLPSVGTSTEDLGATHDTESPPVTSMTRTVFGTPAYMAPEVLMGERSSKASEVYSLGVMLYECLAGRRPYEAPALQELIARVIDGSEPITQLDDPLAELVARMIDRDPAKRPPLSEIAKTLARRRSTIAAHSSTRRPWLVPLAVLTVLGLVVAAIAIAQRRPTTERRAIAIRDLGLVWIPSYGTPPVPQTFTDTLAKLVGAGSVDVIAPERVRQSAPTTSEEWFGAARRESATLIASGHIVESGGRLVAWFEVIDLETGQIERTQLIGDPDRTATLLHEVASWIVGVVRPGGRLESGPNPALATELVALGKDELSKAHGSRARTFLEQAVEEDPTPRQAWDHYAASLEMMAAKQATIEQAAGSAYALASQGPRKHLEHAKQLIYLGRFDQALLELAPLETVQLSKEERRDLLFAIGECHWHEGRHDRGFEYFKRTLELDPTFTEAGKHAGEYAIARRDEATAREYARFQRIPMAHIDFAVGRYEQVVKSGEEPFASWARVVLGLPVERPKTPFATHPAIYDRITDAATKGDRAAATREVESLMTQLEPFTNLTSSLLVQMGEVLLVAEMAEPAKRVLGVLRERQPKYNYKRLAILASPMLGATKFERAVLTERLATLATAIDAELDGDRTLAAKLLDELVKNQTYEWDFVERFALIRNLRALGRVNEAEAICADTLMPPVIRYVFQVARARCLAK